jgi:AcrR family transcriptional regulator
VSRPPGTTATETRGRILETASQLFRDKGFSGTSMRDLSESLGITTAALYYHFDGKDAILDGLVGPFLDAVRAIAETPLGQDHDPEVILRQFAAVLIDHGAAMYAVMNDPSARAHIFQRRDFPEAMSRAERLLAGSDDEYDLLRARCAFGVLQRGLVTRLKNHWPVPTAAGSVPPALLQPPRGVKPTETELAVVVAFAVAGLRSTPMKS